MKITEFFGVSSDPRRGVQPGIGLYEFDLASGSPVRLHDMDLRRLLWEPGASASLELAFEWEREWAPAELVATPFVIMRFAGAHVHRWIEDEEPSAFDPTPDEDPSGQVSDFDWDGASLFELTTFRCQIIFTAESVSITAAVVVGQARA